MPTYTLNELQYSDERKGPFRLYIYGADGYHGGCIWVPDQISKEQMQEKTLEACSQGREVRITDGGDMLVYHAKGENVLYPKEPINFWKEILNHGN